MALNKGITIFLSSHILGEVSKFTHRIGIVHEGRLIQEIDAHELEILCQKRLRIKTLQIDETKQLLTQNNVNFSETADVFFDITDDKYIKNPELLASLLVGNAISLTTLVVVEEDLESYFLRTINI